MRAAAAVAHAGLQAADQLVDDEGQRALVRHAALDAFGHELHLLQLVVLEVAVAAALALAHRFERAHAAVELVGAALVENRLARALFGAGEEAADHDRVGARGERLGDVARELDAAVGDHRDAESLGDLAASAIAVSCGTPTPEMTRVVQIERRPHARP